MLYRKIKACRNCGSKQLEPVLDLGNLAISDFLRQDDPEVQDWYAPLQLVCCEHCTLVQLHHTVERDRLYRGNYWYHSGTNESMKAALRDIVDDALGKKPNAKSVLDIGANDCTMLEMFNLPIMHGFEPSSMGNDTPYNVHVINDYFPPTKTLIHDRYDIITSIACFYDVDDPNAFVSAIKEWLAPDGIWVCQFQDFHHMVATNAFDNICHEHLTYWTADALPFLLAKHGLVIADISDHKVNGGSIRYTIKHGEMEWAPPRLERWMEFRHQLNAFSFYVNNSKIRTMQLLDSLKCRSISVMGYGASTKGNTLLQFFGITPQHVQYIADRNPDKWGRVTAGTHIPIISEEQMRAMSPEYLLVLPWHFLSGFIQREDQWLRAGGHFIVPLPKFSIIGVEPCQSTVAEG